jgi:peptidoglycan/xylan/chitin deacetylase (PgdA/CDA1 family)
MSTAITFDDGLVNFYDNAWPLLQDKKIKSTVFPVAGLIGKTGNWDVMGQTSHMTAPMLMEIAATGHEIGSHSLTHANLVWLDDDELMKELRDSKSILEDITGTAVKSLSFPFGSWNRRVWDAAKSAGYEFAAAYRGHRRVLPGILPVMGVYRFDGVDDVVGRIAPSLPSSPLPSLSLTKTLARMMSHFSKGTPIVKFRKEYVRFPG